jgi:hypothetical protein
VSIPLFRLVQFQLERDVRDGDRLPASLRQGRLLSAVYRIQQPSRPGGRQGLALRLLVDPKRRVAELPLGASVLERIETPEAVEKVAAV